MLAAFLLLALLAEYLQGAAKAEISSLGDPAGPGNDTEAAWSPDGRTIAFQSDRDGSLDLFLLDVNSGQVRPLVHGPGHACFPAWSPDGKWIVYSYAHFTNTAFEGLKNGYNLFVVPVAGGTPRRLTEGLHRDYCPTFSKDGKKIYYSSNQGVEYRRNQVHLYEIPFVGGKPRAILSNDGRGVAHVQPTLSPDSRMVAFGMLHDFRGTWSVGLARFEQLDDIVSLSNSPEAFYGPRWHPTKPLLACSGYQDGDPGWGVYLIDAKTGAKHRVATASGNSRSPAWSPDGSNLVFENNITGNYKLYCMQTPKLDKSVQAVCQESVLDGAVLHYSFQKQAENTVRDNSNFKNHGRIYGKADWKNGGICFRGDNSHIAVQKPRGFDFGSGPFSVRATVKLPEYGENCYICVGADPRSRLGWQLFVDQSGYARFNSRTADGTYCGVNSNARMPKGRVVELVGVRDANGRLSLYVDGVLQYRPRDGAFFSYGRPNEVRIGRQISGKGRFTGTIYDVTVYRRPFRDGETSAALLQRFWGNDGL